MVVSTGKHAMRPCELALQRIDFRSISADARAKHGRDRPMLEIDPSNDVVLGIGQKELSAGKREPFGAGEFGHAGGAAVS
jgi:hypothetical protein